MRPPHLNPLSPLPQHTQEFTNQQVPRIAPRKTRWISSICNKRFQLELSPTEPSYSQPHMHQPSIRPGHLHKPPSQASPPALSPELRKTLNCSKCNKRLWLYSPTYDSQAAMASLAVWTGSKITESDHVHDLDRSKCNAMPADNNKLDSYARTV